MIRSSVCASVALALLTAHANAATSSAVSLESARRALASGDATAAVSMYEALTQQGESLEAELGLVRAALQAGEFRKAMSWATLTAGEHKDSAESVALLAYLHDRIGHTEQALAALERLRAAQPKEAVGVIVQADVLIDRVGATHARAILKEWMTKNPQGRTSELVGLIERAEMAGAASTGVSSGTKSIPSGAPTHTLWHRPSVEAFPIGEKRVVGGGNGIVVDEGRQVLTYAPALPKGATIYVRNGLGKVRRAELLTSGQDLARLRLVEPYPAQWALPKEQIVAPDGTRFCFALGFSLPGSPEGTYPAVAPGLVFRADAGIGGLMQITSALGTGHAGSPVFDPRGRLIGIATGAGDVMVGGRNLRGQVGAGQFALRTVAAPLAGKDAAPLRPAGPLPPMPAIEELYERLTPAVVQIIAVE